MGTPLLVQIDPLDPQGKSYERIQMAIDMIEQNGFKASGKPKCSFREAAEMFRLSKTTLTERFKGPPRVSQARAETRQCIPRHFS